MKTEYHPLQKFSCYFYPVCLQALLLPGQEVPHLSGYYNHLFQENPQSQEDFFRFYYISCNHADKFIFEREYSSNPSSGP